MMSLTRFLFIALFDLLLISQSFSVTASPSNDYAVLKTVKLELTTHLGDHQVFVNHDIVNFYISLDLNAYLYAFYQDATGTLYQILPSAAQTDHFFKAGDFIAFPSQSSEFNLTVQPPFGRETLFLFASDNPELTFSDKKMKSKAFTQIEYSPKQIANIIKSTSKRLYGETSLILITQQK